MVFKDITVTNPKGLDAKTAAALATICMNCSSRVQMSIGQNSVNPTSVYEIMARPIKWGARLSFICDGETEKEDLEKIIACVTAVPEE